MDILEDPQPEYCEFCGNISEDLLGEPYNDIYNNIIYDLICNSDSCVSCGLDICGKCIQNWSENDDPNEDAWMFGDHNVCITCNERLSRTK